MERTIFISPTSKCRHAFCGEFPLARIGGFTRDQQIR
jgi:hypothetical protein